MEQMKNKLKQKRVRKANSFISVINSWCSKEYVKITFPGQLEADAKEIQKLLDDSANDKKEAPG